jgi:hypothetical protein
MGLGEEPNHTAARKPGNLYILPYSLIKIFSCKDDIMNRRYLWNDGELGSQSPQSQFSNIDSVYQNPSTERIRQ